MAANPNQPVRELDSFDRAILRILQHDNKTPQRTIADQVNLSAAAVQRRIAAMEKSGIILRNMAVLDEDALSLTITAIVEVHLSSERIETVDAAKAFFLNDPDVQQAYYVTGGVSFVLIIVARDMPAYEALTRRLFAQNDLVDRYRSLIALDRVKTSGPFVLP